VGGGCTGPGGAGAAVAMPQPCAHPTCEMAWEQQQARWRDAPRAAVRWRLPGCRRGPPCRALGAMTPSPPPPPPGGQPSAPCAEGCSRGSLLDLAAEEEAHAPGIQAALSRLCTRSSGLARRRSPLTAHRPPLNAPRPPPSPSPPPPRHPRPPARRRGPAGRHQDVALRAAGVLGGPAVHAACQGAGDHRWARWRWRWALGAGGGAGAGRWG
jgi:hypothetical protein